MPLYGKFSDIYGRRSVMMFALIWFLGGSLFCGFSTSIWLLIAGRAVQGVGSGGLMSLTMILIGDIAKPAVRAKYMSSISAIFGLATVLGPLIGGGFTEYVTWRWVFFINAPLVAITMIVTWILLKKIQNAQKNLRIDYFGSILIVLATSAFVLMITWGGVSYAWSSPEIISLIVISAVLFAGFVVQELYFSEPLIRFELYKIRNYTLSTIIMFLFGMALFGGFTFLPFYFEDVIGNSAIITGLKIVPMVAGVMSTSMFTGAYISKTGNFIVFPVLGMSVFSVGLGLLVLMGTKTNYGLDVLYMFILGAGMGLIFPVYNTIVQNSVPQQHMASSIATLVFVRQIGACIGVSILGTVYQRFTNKYLKEFGYHNIAESESRALHMVFEVTLAFSLAALIVAFGIKNEKLFVRAPKITTNEKGNNTDTNKAQEPPKQITEQNVEVEAFVI
jgi:EmrB/QacA subfamily drug resistance transporter